MSRIGRSDSLGGYGDLEVLQVRKVKRYERIGMSEILGGRKFLEVRVSVNFGC
jgi:hypothetical protein